MDKSAVPSAPLNPTSSNNYPLGYTGIAPVLFNLSAGSASWIDLNVGGSLPAAALVAEVIIMPTSTVLAGVRKVGSGLTRNYLMLYPFGMNVECGSRHIEGYEPATFGVNYILIGYWS